MRHYPIPANDAARKQAVTRIDLASRSTDPFLGHTIGLVKSLLDVPIAFVSAHTGDAQQFVASCGLDAPSTPRDHSLCAFVVTHRQTMVVADVTQDPRLQRNPVTAQLDIRFWASAPIILSNGFCVGTVCGLDHVPRSMDAAAVAAQLEAIAGMLARFYEAPREPDPAYLDDMKDIAKRAQTEFLALVGHELRTPLNGIHGLAQVLEPQDVEEAEIAEGIIQSAMHLHNVVKSVLDFTELASGDIQLEERVAPLVPLLDRALAPHRKIAQSRGSAIHLVPPLQEHRLRVDPARFELALSCIVNNAVIHGGSAIEIRAQGNDDGTLCIDICDNGPGIDTAKRDEIWDVFTVGQDVHARAADGLGLGLPLARRIVELHGGEISAGTAGGQMCIRVLMPHWRMVDMSE